MTLHFATSDLHEQTLSSELGLPDRLLLANESRPLTTDNGPMALVAVCMLLLLTLVSSKDRARWLADHVRFVSVSDTSGLLYPSLFPHLTVSPVSLSHPCRSPCPLLPLSVRSLWTCVNVSSRSSSPVTLLILSSVVHALYCTVPITICLLDD